jgi:hypothetical protein
LAAQRRKVERDEVPAEGTRTVPEFVETPVTVTTDILGDTMKVAISRSFKVNMGDYESADSFASVTVEVPTDTDLGALSTRFGHVLDSIQHPDMTMFKMLTKQPRSIAKQVDFSAE